MKVHLLYQDTEFDWRLVNQAMEASENSRRGWSGRDDDYFDSSINLVWNAEELITDLALNTVFEAMAKKDDCVLETSKRVILADESVDSKTIEYRQNVLQDCLNNSSVISELYDLAVKALEKKRGHYISNYTKKHPDSMLRESIYMLDELLDSLRKLNNIAKQQTDKFKSEGFKNFFAMIKRDLGDDYLAEVEHHLAKLKLRHQALLISAGLNQANKGSNYLLHQAPERKKSIWTRSKALLTNREPIYSFKLDPRDDAGLQALSELRDSGIGLVAGDVGQSADNVSDFFEMLRVELAFYVGCLNLQKLLSEKGEPICIPRPLPLEETKLTAQGLYDISLSLIIDKQVVGNDINSNNKGLIFITGTNTGGKSTFLRSVGLAQLMMQAGMFVGAQSYTANFCNGLLTHYKREEDTEMESGKFDEEMKRMSDIVDHIKPRAMILFNESFAATNEREGSEIARQIISVLIDKGIKVMCVTHLYELVYSFYQTSRSHTLFLQAEHQKNSTRTFKMIENQPLPTSYGEDLYKKIFNGKKVNQL